MLTPSSIDHQEKIFSVFFHQVLFPRKFFELGGIGHQVVEKGGIIPDFVKVELSFILYFNQFILQLMAGKDIIAVEKHHPHYECNRGQKIFVQEETQYFHPILFLSGIDKFLSAT